MRSRHQPGHLLSRLKEVPQRGGSAEQVATAARHQVASHQDWNLSTIKIG